MGLRLRKDTQSRARRGSPETADRRPPLSAVSSSWLKRRRFIVRAAAVAAACAAAVCDVMPGRTFARYREAKRTRGYPGPRKPLVDAEIRKPGRWGG
jgi:hypothetical protein